MDILEMGADLIGQKLGVNVDSETIKSALSGLLGDGQGGVDLAGLAGKMAQSGNLGSIASSWLGDGSNSPIDADSLLGLLGEDKVSAFANSLGTDTQSAAQGLSDVVPEIMDKSSSGGNLLEAAGGLGGLLGAAKSFLS